MSVDLYFSGGASNTDPDVSLGGAKSSAPAYISGSTTSLFSINASERAAGTIQYRLLYVQVTDYLNTLKFFVRETPFATTTIALAWAAAAINAIETAVADELTPPAGVTFASPSTIEDAGSGGDFKPGQWRGLWVELAVQAGSPAAAEQIVLDYAANGPARMYTNGVPMFTNDQAMFSF